MPRHVNVFGLKMYHFQDCAFSDVKGVSSKKHELTLTHEVAASLDVPSVCWRISEEESTRKDISREQLSR